MMANSSTRSISRIPLDIFTNLIRHRDDDPYSPSDLRDMICRKLLDAGPVASSDQKNNNGHSSGTTYFVPFLIPEQGITTVGQLMRLAPTTLLRALDPLLTNGKEDWYHTDCIIVLNLT